MLTVSTAPGRSRRHNCHSTVISRGRSSSGVGLTTRPKMSLWRFFASRNSARHHFDRAHSGEMRNSTASQRSAARRSASCQRSPAASPRSGSMSRKTSSQPLLASQRPSATASSSFALEWLRNMRAIGSPDRPICRRRAKPGLPPAASPRPKVPPLRSGLPSVSQAPFVLTRSACRYARTAVARAALAAASSARPRRRSRSA